MVLGALGALLGGVIGAVELQGASWELLGCLGSLWRGPKCQNLEKATKYIEKRAKWDPRQTDSQGVAHWFLDPMGESQK